MVVYVTEEYELQTIEQDSFEQRKQQLLCSRSDSAASIYIRVNLARYKAITKLQCLQTSQYIKVRVDQ